EKNELIAIDSPYSLKRVEDFISSIDNPQKQMREEDFQIKYAQLEKVKSSIEEELSSYGKLKVDRERSLLLVGDFSYNLEKIEKIISRLDSFKPERRIYSIRFAPLSQVEREIKVLLSDKGKVKVDEKTDTLLVSDVEKSLLKVDELISKLDVLSSQLIGKVNFKEEDLRDALDAISLKTGLNIIIGPRVEGKVTASFPRPTPVLKALQIILEGSGCEYRREDDVIKVAKAGVPLPILTRSFQIKYALGTELVSSIKPLLSDKGTLKVNEQANTLIVTDAQKNLTGIKDAILKLDEPVRQMQTRNFSLRFIQAKKAGSILKSHLSKAGEIEVDSSANSLLVRDVAYKMKEIPSFLSSLDVFKEALKVFPLKFALASEVSELISAYLSPEGKLNVNKEKNELIAIDSPYSLKRVEDFISSIDNPQKQMREEDFQIKYAQMEKVKSSIEEELSSYGKLKVDRERSLLLVGDFSYNLEKIKRIINRLDSFKSERRIYSIRFAPLSQVEREIKELLSDKGEVKVDEKTDTLLVSDVEKNLLKVDKLISKLDVLSSQLISKVNFKEEDLRDALHTISLKTGLNIIVGPRVEGKVTASFPRPTPVLKALQIILKGSGCEYRREDDVIKVAKAGVPLPILTRSFQIKYALGTELVSSIKPLLSDKGTLKVNEQANTLIVTDAQKNLTGIKDAILKLDEPVRQMQTRNFSLRFIQAKKAGSILKSHLSKAGEIEVDSSANSLLVRDVAYKMKEIPSFLSSLDVFKEALKVFPLKFALASEVSELISAYLSPEGKLNVNKEKNELIAIDSPYSLKRVEDFISSIDNPQKQMREEDFQIKYAQLEKVKSSIEEELSSYGKLKVDRERSLLLVGDFSYNLEKIKRIINRLDSFKSERRIYSIRFAPLSQVEREIKVLLSDKGEVKVDEKTDTLLVSDVEKSLLKVDKLISKLDVLSSQLITKKYFLKYLTSKEAKFYLQSVISEYGKISLPQVKAAEEGKKNIKEDYIIIPQDKSEKEIKSKSLKEKDSPKNSLYEDKNIIYVTDLKKNISRIDEKISRMNSSSIGEAEDTKTFYIEEGSLDNIALTIANMIGVKPEDIKGIELTEKEGQWMKMNVPSPSINLGTIGPGK
ncbi:MAG: hypothetical protein U9O41_09290, partial [Candidatus Aerophobetes bacterium]|nr:hypothetical protein [Candidatus Aerophobetes bacterium]